MKPRICIFVITNSTGAGTLTMTDTKLYATVLTLSTQNDTKLIKELKFGFKRTIKY